MRIISGLDILEKIKSFEDGNAVNNEIKNLLMKGEGRFPNNNRLNAVQELALAITKSVFGDVKSK